MVSGVDVPFFVNPLIVEDADDVGAVWFMSRNHHKQSSLDGGSMSYGSSIGLLVAIIYFTWFTSSYGSKLLHNCKTSPMFSGKAHYKL